MRVNGLAGVVAALALVAVSCTSVGDAQPVDSSTTSSPVLASTTSFAPRSDGVPVGRGVDATASGGHGSVLVPSDSVSGPGSLVVQPAVVEPPENMELLGEAFDVSLVDTELTGTVLFAIDSPPPPDGFPDDLPTIWLGTFNESTGEWTPIETVLADGKAVAEVDHFTRFGWIRPNLDWLGDTFNGLVQSVLGPGVFGVEQPVCDNEQLARNNGVEVTSDSGSSTFWCLGVEDSETVLKVTNNRRYSVGMNLPDGFTLLARERSSGVIEALNPVADSAFGFDVTLSRGEEVTMGVPNGGSGEIVVEPSPGTFLLDTLSIEIDFVASVFKVDSVATAAALSGKCLVDNVPDLFSNDLQDAVSSAFSSTFGCMSDVFAETIFDGWLANMLWGFVSSTIRLVIEGLFGAVSGIADSIRGIFDGSDFYAIAVSSVSEQTPDLRALTTSLSCADIAAVETFFSARPEIFLAGGVLGAGDFPQSSNWIIYGFDAATESTDFSIGVGSQPMPTAVIDGEFVNVDAGYFSGAFSVRQGRVVASSARWLPRYDNQNAVYSTGTDVRPLGVSDYDPVERAVLTVSPQWDREGRMYAIWCDDTLWSPGE